MVATLPGVPYGPLPAAARAAQALAQPPRLIVIHDTSNSATAKAEASYAATRSVSGATSAHFYVDTAGPLGSCPLDIQAWAAYSYANAHGWHVEMCGYNAKQPGAVPPATIALTARLVRQLCELADIPMVKLSPADVAAGKRGICGHADITTGLGVGDHDDPGSAFDWPAFIAAVKEEDMALRDDADGHALIDRVASIFSLSPSAAFGANGKAEPNQLASLLLSMKATLSALAGKDWVNEQEIVTGVLAGLASLTPEAIADHLAAVLPADLAKQVADELAHRLAQ